MLGFTVHTIAFDYMHCKHLGTDKSLLGSVLYVLVNYILDAEPEQNVQQVWL